MFVAVIKAKLTPEVRRNIEREHSSSQWNLSDLLAALQKEIRVLQSGQLDPSSTLFKGTTTAAFQVGARDKTDHSASRNSKKRESTCAFCKGPHPTHSCKTVTDHQKRIDVVKRKPLSQLFGTPQGVTMPVQISV